MLKATIDERVFSFKEFVLEDKIAEQTSPFKGGKVILPRFTNDRLYSFQLRLRYLSFFLGGVEPFLGAISNLKFLSKQQKIYRFEILKTKKSSALAIYAK